MLIEIVHNFQSETSGILLILLTTSIYRQLEENGSRRQLLYQSVQIKFGYPPPLRKNYGYEPDINRNCRFAYLEEIPHIFI